MQLLMGCLGPQDGPVADPGPLGDRGWAGASPWVGLPSKLYAYKGLDLHGRLFNSCNRDAEILGTYCTPY